ncbi:MAG TPA: hypothetical protein VNJ28_04475, partial [Candidatus Limnocylindrales bacterium]|nr:hypothetical protein [Candidatus Limnocylindrales bacterium]
MVGRPFLGRVEPGPSLGLFDRLAPPPPHDLIVSRIEAHSAPGDVVLDLHGRGGWVARAAIDRQRRAVTIESSPLSRLLAEVVLRPPDIRHLDAAFQAISAAPRGETNLRLAVGERFATRCPTCGRQVIADEFVWAVPSIPDTPPVPVRKHFRCPACRDRVGRGEQRHAPVDDADLERARDLPADDAVRSRIRERFPIVDGAAELLDDLLALHTGRTIAGLAAILERIEGDLRAAPVEAVLRLGFLHALLPASRLHTYPGRVATLRLGGGRVRLPAGEQWRERNPWLAFEEGFRVVRGFVQRLEAASPGPVQARYGEDVRALLGGAATVTVRLGTASAYAALAAEGAELARLGEPS